MADDKPTHLDPTLESAEVSSAREVSTALEEALTPRRTFSGTLDVVVRAVAIAFALWQLYVLGVYPIEPWFLRSIHAGFLLALGMLIIPGWRRARRNRPVAVDMALAVLAVLPTFYVFADFDGIIARGGVEPIATDVIFGVILILITLEVTRRATGWALPIITAIFFAYALFGHLLEGVLWHRPYSFARIVAHMFSLEGIYTTPIAVSASYVFLFVVFGAFLQASGTGRLFIDLAWAVAGWARGGPAKMSVFSSSLFGTISGSAVANVVVDGWLTIPLMKSVGYSPRFAAAVEALTSTGGQIMPPIMGAAAFLMAEIVGVPYVHVAAAATIPAILYYLSLYLVIDLEALKHNLRGLPRENLPKLGPVLRDGWHLLLPIGILLFSLIVVQDSPVRAGLWGILACIGASWIRPRTGMRPKQVADALDAGTRGMIDIAATTAAAGIIIGVLSITGLGVRFANIMIGMSGGNVLVALVLSMFVAIVLGMGVPTTAAYAISAATIAPGLIQMGLQPMAAHMFILYFASLSTITPPVALASYAAAAIARANPTEAGLTALRLGLAAFIVPYMFVFGPSLLLDGPPEAIARSFMTASVGILALAVAVQGWFTGPVSVPLRLVSFVAALLLIHTGAATDVVGFVLFGVVLFTHRPALLGRFIRRPSPRQP